MNDYLAEAAKQMLCIVAVIAIVLLVAAFALGRCSNSVRLQSPIVVDEPQPKTDLPPRG